MPIFCGCSRRGCWMKVLILSLGSWPGVWIVCWFSCGPIVDGRTWWSISSTIRSVSRQEVVESCVVHSAVPNNISALLKHLKPIAKRFYWCQKSLSKWRLSWATICWCLDGLRSDTKPGFQLSRSARGLLIARFRPFFATESLNLAGKDKWRNPPTNVQIEMLFISLFNSAYWNC